MGMVGRNSNYLGYTRGHRTTESRLGHVLHRRLYDDRRRASRCGWMCRSHGRGSRVRLIVNSLLPRRDHDSGTGVCAFR